MLWEQSNVTYVLSEVADRFNSLWLLTHQKTVSHPETRLLAVCPLVRVYVLERAKGCNRCNINESNTLISANACAHVNLKTNTCKQVYIYIYILLKDKHLHGL